MLNSSFYFNHTNKNNKKKPPPNKIKYHNTPKSKIKLISHDTVVP